MNRPQSEWNLIQDFVQAFASSCMWWLHRMELIKWKKGAGVVNWITKRLWERELDGKLCRSFWKWSREIFSISRPSLNWSVVGLILRNNCSDVKWKLFVLWSAVSGDARWSGILRNHFEFARSWCVPKGHRVRTELLRIHHRKARKKKASSAFLIAACPTPVDVLVLILARKKLASQYNRKPKKGMLAKSRLRNILQFSIFFRLTAEPQISLRSAFSVLKFISISCPSVAPMNIVVSLHLLNLYTISQFSGTQSLHKLLLIKQFPFKWKTFTTNFIARGKQTEIM